MKNFKKGLILILVMLLTGCFAAVSKTDKKETDKPVKKKDEKQVYKVSLVATGDGLIHSTVYQDAFDGKNYDFKKQVELIKPIVSKFDLAFYNQETIFGGSELGYSNYPLFNTPSEFGDAMIDAGFNMVALANNHSLDKGERGVLNAMSYWKKQNVLTAGAADSFEYRDNIQIKEKNNITYALLAYTTTTNGIPVPSGKEYLVNVYNAEKVKTDVEKIRDKVDILIVSMHWGAEYTHTPVNEEVTIANYLAELGVDIVIGTHPHVLQPITKIGNTVVMYSLGNFISAQIGIERLVGMLAMLDITKEVDKGETTITIDNIRGDLTYTYRDSSWRNIKIVPFSVMEDKYLSNNQEVYNKYKEIVLRMDNSIEIIGLKSGLKGE